MGVLDSNGYKREITRGYPAKNQPKIEKNGYKGEITHGYPARNQRRGINREYDKKKTLDLDIGHTTPIERIRPALGRDTEDVLGYALNDPFGSGVWLVMSMQRAGMSSIRDWSAEGSNPLTLGKARME
jgi:hypothetical protein